MSNELTDVRCPCGDEYPADSYDAGFIAGSGMCQNCDAALPPKDICTCPSGGGSLRHPCPAHPESVEMAGVAAKLTFINGRPAMCGCQVEYSSGGGEYSDVIYVTLCAKHSGSAILDLVATNRIALTPEYEGQWHADFYLDREIPLAKAEGATPAEAVLALMSAERIDPEQESVEQAGGDERAVDGRPRAIECPACGEQELMPGDLCSCGYETDPAAGFACSECDGSGDGYVGEVCRECDGSGWFVTPEQARADLAQPSPKSGDYSDQSWINAGCPPEQPEQAEAERPEVVARVVHSNPIVLGQCGPLNANDELMTVAQHAASVARWAEMFNRVEQERDAALARVAELEALMQMNFGELHTARNLLSRLSVSGVNVDAILGGQLQDLVIVPADATLEMVEALKRSLTVTNRGTLLNAGHALNASIAASPFAKKAPEPVMCPRCEGEGTLRTGIDESPSTICKRCDGVGTIAAAPGKEGV
ncbi:TPA: hypothetical protein ONA83_003592 [Pseudomonas aeruginosa]|nr:hypothetical protein [Pseudomonas aeruginosa]